MPAAHYRKASSPSRSCSRCGAAIDDPATLYLRRGGSVMCQSCFFGQADLFALVGIALLFGGAASGSNTLLAGGLLIPCIGAYLMYRSTS